MLRAFVIFNFLTEKRFLKQEMCQFLSGSNTMIVSRVQCLPVIRLRSNTYDYKSTKVAPDCWLYNGRNFSLCEDGFRLTRNVLVRELSMHRKQGGCSKLEKDQRDGAYLPLILVNAEN